MSQESPDARDGYGPETPESTGLAVSRCGTCGLYARGVLVAESWYGTGLDDAAYIAGGVDPDDPDESGYEEWELDPAWLASEGIPETRGMPATLAEIPESAWL